jgi:hypothetical protein
MNTRGENFTFLRQFNRVMCVFLFILIFSLFFPKVSGQDQPFSNTPSNEYGTLTMTPVGSGMRFRFDPTDNVMCDKIVFSQTVRLVFLNGGDTPYKSGDIWDFWRYHDDDTLENGTFIDHVSTTEDPYNNGDDRDGRHPSAGGPGVKEDRGIQGKRNPSGTTAATWSDGPRLSARIFPEGKGTVRIEFEICVMCAAGNQAGTVYGCATWTYTQPRNGRGSSTSTTGDSLQPPSSTWQLAMDLYEENHINERGERYCPEE